MGCSTKSSKLAGPGSPRLGRFDSFAASLHICASGGAWGWSEPRDPRIRAFRDSRRRRKDARARPNAGLRQPSRAGSSVAPHSAPQPCQQLRRGGRRTFAARSRRTSPRLSTPARCMTNAAVACPRNVRAKAVDDASITGGAQRYSRAALGADVHSRLRCRTRPETRGRVVRTRSSSPAPGPGAARRSWCA